MLRGNGHSGQTLRQRHGRRLVYRHPSALSLPKLQEFVEYFFTSKKESNIIPIPLPAAKREQSRSKALLLIQKPASAAAPFPLKTNQQNPIRDHKSDTIYPIHAPTDSKKELFPSEIKTKPDENRSSNYYNNTFATGQNINSEHQSSFDTHTNRDLVLLAGKESHTPVSTTNSTHFFQGFSADTPFTQSFMPTPVASADIHNHNEVEINRLHENERDSPSTSSSISDGKHFSNGSDNGDDDLDDIRLVQEPENVTQKDDEDYDEQEDNGAEEEDKEEGGQGDEGEGESDGFEVEEHVSLVQDIINIAQAEEHLKSTDASTTTPELETKAAEISAESDKMLNFSTDASIMSEKEPSQDSMRECDMEMPYKVAEMYGSTHTANDSVSFYSCTDDGAFVPELAAAFAHDSDEENEELEGSADELHVSNVPDSTQEEEWKILKSDDQMISPVKAAFGSFLDDSTTSSIEIQELISSNLVNLSGDKSHSTDEIPQRLFDESIDINNSLTSDENDIVESPLAVSYSLQYEQNYGQPLLESDERESIAAVNAPFVPPENHNLPPVVAAQHFDANGVRENYDSPPKRQPLLNTKPTHLHGQDDLSAKFRLQAAELEEVTRARAALEIRLQETRQILEVFANGGNTRAIGGVIPIVANTEVQKVSVVKFQEDYNETSLALSEENEVATKDVSPADQVNIEIDDEEKQAESPQQLSETNENNVGTNKRAVGKKHVIDKKIKFRLALKKALSKSSLQKNAEIKPQNTVNKVQNNGTESSIDPRTTTTVTVAAGDKQEVAEPTTMPSSNTAATAKSDEPPSATKLLRTTSKFFSGKSVPSEIFEARNYDYISNRKESRKPPSLPSSPKVVDSPLVLSHSSNPVSVRGHVPTSPPSSLSSSVALAPSVNRLKNVGNVSKVSGNEQNFKSNNVSNLSSPTQSEKVLSPDSGSKVSRGGHFRKLSQSAPRVVTLELPDFEDEDQSSPKNDIHQEPIANVSNKQSDSVEISNKMSMPARGATKGPADSIRNVSEEAVSSIDKIPSQSRSRSNSQSSLLRKKSNSSIQVPSDVSYQYLSQLRYVLEEIDDVISSTPPVRTDDSFTMETALPIELDAVAAAAVAAAAAVSVANRKSLHNSNMYRRTIGDSAHSEEDSLQRRQFVFDGNNASDREFVTRDTDDEASFPSINSKDKIVNLRKRPSHNPVQRAGYKRDDASSEMFSSDRPSSSQRSFQPPTDYYCGGDSVSVTSGITMESTLPTSPSPMKSDISIPGTSTSHLPVYSYIEQDFEYFFRAQQQHRLNEMRNSNESNGMDIRRYPVPAARVGDDELPQSTVGVDKATGSNPIHTAFSMSLSYSSSLQSREEWGSNNGQLTSSSVEKESKSVSNEKLNKMPTTSQSSSSSLSNSSSAERETSMKDNDLDNSENESSVSPESPSFVTAGVLDSHMRVVLSYFGPFLVAMKVSESSYASKASLDSAWEPILWCIFQMYGIADSVVVKHIKTSQISRALKDAGICTINSSQLDLMLVKVHLKLSAAKDDVASSLISPVSSNSTRRSNLYLQSALTKSLTGKNSSSASIGTSNATTAISQNTATFEAFKELYNKIAEHIVMSKPHKKAGSGSAGATDSTLFAQLEAMHTKFKELILLRTYDACEVHLLESKVSISGLLLDTVYQRATSLPHSMRELSHKQRSKEYLQQLIAKSVFLSYAPSDIAVVKAVWERNFEQSRQIFLCYATPCTPSKHMLGFEECREMMADFRIVPQLLDSQCFARLFRTCKLFEWRLAEMDSSNADAIGGSAAGKPNPALQEDFFDFKSTMGNYSLTFYGFLELLTRIACNNNKLGRSPPQSLENLLHLMDISGGKAKLNSKSSRKSVSAKSFVYANKN